ncbi:hypothetical protein DWZ31_16870 [Roseburia intestinalis]|jgi:hypothetical protein|uniref:Glycosyltransferase n=1 Tax=Roseburia intestinalis TaxID=166486 RepID=A0A3R6JDE2_9FIRM|nr:hypothetical protein [Roseburia intestinalis]RHN04199.1 hypothetical protein DWZ31_16870 [Roseburia intestinalis]
MTILEYLDVIKTYPMEDYFARYGEIEQVLKQAEEAIQKNPEETQKSLLREIAGAADNAADWMRVHILSFCMRVSGEEIYALELLDLILDASYEDIGEYNKLSHFWQIGTVQFLNQKLQTPAVNQKMARLYRELFGLFCDSFGVKERKYVPWQDRNHNLVFVFSSQVLGMEHAPTKTLLDRCYVLKKYLKKEVVVINTAMQIPAKGQAPFYGLVNASYAEELSGLKELEFRGETFEFHQCENKMPDLGIMADIIQLVRNRKPEFILSIGGSDICADLCGLFVPQITISTVFSKIAISCGEYQMVDKALTEDDRKQLAILGVKEEKVKQTPFTFSFKEQIHTYTREQLGLWQDKFILLLVGWRLDQEIDDSLLQMLEEVLEENTGIAVTFMGLFATYENRVNGYERLHQNSINLGKQMDALAVTECCDLYVNPKRSGGGSSVSEALYQGIPAVTLPVGDVSVAAGADFWVSDYSAMKQLILRYATEKEFYDRMAVLARKRAEELIDSKTLFGKSICEIEKELKKEKGHIIAAAKQKENE